MDPEQLLQLAQQAGVTDAEVNWFSSSAQPLFFEANRLKQIEIAQTEGVSLRVWQGDRCGLAVAYGSVDPHLLLEKALALSQVSEPDPALMVSSSPQTWALTAPTMTLADLKRMGQQVIDDLLIDYPDVLCGGDWILETSQTRLINSRGLDARLTDYGLEASMQVEWVRGDDLLQVDAFQTVAPRPQQQDPVLQPHLLVQTLRQSLQWATHTTELPESGSWPVIFTPKAADTLLETLAAALNGRRVLQGSSPWSEKLGQPVVSPLLTLRQDPGVGPYGSPFDDEGIPCRPLSLIEAGRLQQFYTDQRTAQELRIPPTGNGFRSGLGTFPAPGLYNLILPEAELTFNQLLQQMQRGLVVDQILGSGGGLSGDFSFTVDLGYWVEQGEIVGRIKDTMLAGNAYHALNDLVALGRDPVDPEGRIWNGLFYTPALWIGSLSVSL